MLFFIFRQICSEEEVSSSNEKIEDNPEHRDIKSLLYTENTDRQKEQKRTDEMEGRTGSEDGDIDDSLQPESKMEEEMCLEGSADMTIQQKVPNRIASVAQMTTKEDFDREFLQVEAEFDRQIGKIFAIVSLIG